MTERFTPLPEPRPRDFSARFRRARPRKLAAARRRLPDGRHLLVLAGAVALPAFAAPDDWSAFVIGDAGDAKVMIEPMPFEKPGSSFPGSAFYYLAADDTPRPAWGEGIHSDAGHPANVPPSLTGPVARALRIDNSGVDRGRAIQCLTAAVYYEAASEPDSGQRAVAQVVLNRVAHSAYPDTVCGVVYQGSERRTGCQFSFTCDGSLARRPHSMFWLRAETVARAALAGYVHAPAGLATHYHTIHVSPYWAPSLAYLGTIGLHRFYSFGGKAGHPGAFRFAYGGGEPIAAPHPRNQTAATAAEDRALDPVALQAAFDTGLKSAQAQHGGGPGHTGGNGASLSAPSRPAAPPVYTRELRERGGDTLYQGDKLPEATGIRPEYRNSGRWITQPGT